MRVRLRNDFHNTAVEFRLPANGWLRARTVSRIRRALCPSPECRCGGSLGERPYRVHVLAQDNEGNLQVEIPEVEE